VVCQRGDHLVFIYRARQDPWLFLESPCRAETSGSKLRTLGKGSQSQAHLDRLASQSAPSQENNPPNPAIWNASPTKAAMASTQIFAPSFRLNGQGVTAACCRLGYRWLQDGYCDDALQGDRLQRIFRPLFAAVRRAALPSNFARLRGTA
jgi:hypothetical protein